MRKLSFILFGLLIVSANYSFAEDHAKVAIEHAKEIRTPDFTQGVQIPNKQRAQGQNHPHAKHFANNGALLRKGLPSVRQCGTEQGHHKQLKVDGHIPNAR